MKTNAELQRSRMQMGDTSWRSNITAAELEMMPRHGEERPIIVLIHEMVEPTQTVQIQMILK